MMICALYSLFHSKMATYSPYKDLLRHCCAQVFTVEARNRNDVEFNMLICSSLFFVILLGDQAGQVAAPPKHAAQMQVVRYMSL